MIENEPSFQILIFTGYLPELPSSIPKRVMHVSHQQLVLGNWLSQRTMLRATQTTGKNHHTALQPPLPLSEAL